MSPGRAVDIPDDDVRDEQAGSGWLHRAQNRGWRRHPTHPNEYVCADDKPCGAWLHGEKTRNQHVRWHRDQAANEAEWMAEVERLTERAHDYETELAELRGQVTLMTELLGPALAQIMDERDPR
jgi:hypothetical protein